MLLKVRYESAALFFGYFDSQKVRASLNAGGRVLKCVVQILAGLEVFLFA